MGGYSGQTDERVNKTYRGTGGRQAIKGDIMKIKLGEIKVFYRLSDDFYIDQKVDNAIEKCLNDLGYERWASGVAMDGTRDLAFDKIKSAE